MEKTKYNKNIQKNVDGAKNVIEDFIKELDNIEKEISKIIKNNQKLSKLLDKHLK